MTKSATTLTIGRWVARARLLKIQIGRVASVPAVKFVTTISSNERANARRPAAGGALRTAGKVTYQMDFQAEARRAIDAFSIGRDDRRSRAVTLLNTTPMQ